VLEPDVLSLVPKGEPFDFSRNLFPLMLESKMVLAGSRVSGFWVDIGDSRSYLRANMWALDKLEPGQTTASDRIICGPGSSISETATLRGPAHLGNNVKVDEGAVVGPYACIGDESEISAGARIAYSAVYENTRIGNNAILNTCIVAENCRVGDRVQIERNAVVGAGTELGSYSHLAAESRVGPWTVLQPRTTVEGAVTTFKNDIERVCALLEKSDTCLGLTSEQGRVCRALCELGEADAKSIGRIADVPYPRIDSVLFDLQQRGMVTSFGNVPKMFALVREVS
jgi:bifunctional N-acetylglucosamine-1-phosphate-uridyltransferase/glucosamine-1-phosphate-acetyltransferase GlmU-like protein